MELRLINITPAINNLSYLANNFENGSQHIPLHPESYLDELYGCSCKLLLKYVAGEMLVYKILYSIYVYRVKYAYPNTLIIFLIDYFSFVMPGL